MKHILLSLLIFSTSVFAMTGPQPGNIKCTEQVGQNKITCTGASGYTYNYSGYDVPIIDGYDKVTFNPEDFCGAQFNKDLCSSNKITFSYSAIQNCV